MKDALLAQTIASGHGDGITQQAAEIRQAIHSLRVAEQRRKAAWLALSEMLDRFPTAAQQCRTELAEARAEARAEVAEAG